VVCKMAMDEGHCGLPTDLLIPLAEELLEAPKDLILTALELERSEGAVIADKVGDTACIFLAGLYRAEQAIAERLIRIVNGRLPWPWIDEEKAVPWIEKRSGLQLADSQRAARLGADGEGAGDHRRAGCRQDDDRQFDP
jgi:exodeoxyribonuclease V alpha subunit